MNVNNLCRASAPLGSDLGKSREGSEKHIRRHFKPEHRRSAGDSDGDIAALKLGPDRQADEKDFTQNLGLRDSGPSKGISDATVINVNGQSRPVSRLKTGLFSTTPAGGTGGSGIRSRPATLASSA